MQMSGSRVSRVECLKGNVASLTTSGRFSLRKNVLMQRINGELRNSASSIVAIHVVISGSKPSFSLSLGRMDAIGASIGRDNGGLWLFAPFFQNGVSA